MTEKRDQREYGNGYVSVTGYTTKRIKQRFKVRCAKLGVSMSERIAHLVAEDLKRKGD